MSTQPIKVLFFGATGYIGGSTLTTLLSSTDIQNKNIQFTLFVRNEEKKKQLEQHYGQHSQKHLLQYVVHSYSDFSFIQELASEFDIVMNLANADDKDLAVAICDGLGKRKVNTVLKKPIYIHTSGTSLLNGWVKPGSEVEFSKVWSDKEAEDLWNFPAAEPHHEIDLAVLHQSERNNISLISMFPPTITGIGTGIHNLSIQVPYLIRAALARGQGGYVGTGLNSWSYINIIDLSDAYLVLLNSAIEGKADTGRNGLYFAENGHYQHKELAKKIAETLHKLDPQRMPTTNLKPFTKEEIDKHLFGDMCDMVFCGNSVCKADRTRELGWKPHHPGLFETLEEECKIILAEKH